MPENLWTLRVDRLSRLTPDQVEDRFHVILVAALHGRPGNTRAGREWFLASVEFHDGIAVLLGPEVHKSDDLS